MTEKDYHLYGTKVLNVKTQEIGLLICTWKNKFADAEVDFATCVDRQGKKYNIELDNLRGFEVCSLGFNPTKASFKMLGYTTFHPTYRLFHKHLIY